MNGVVFAAIYDEELNVKHTLITNKSEILSSMGSKYVASELGNTYKNVNDCLKKYSIVMFVGTPCQCAGLYSYISIANKSKLDKLFLVDVVCMGVPSRLIWQKYLDEDRNRSSIKSINMRDKSAGWLKYGLAVEYVDGFVKREMRNENRYLLGYVECIFLRPSCYDCKFKGIDRITDLTLGDLWGCDTFDSNLYQYNGTSLIMCHSKRGENFLNDINDKIRISTIQHTEDVLKHNHCIVDSVPYHNKRDLFFSMIDSGATYSKAIHSVMKKKITHRIVHKLQMICITIKRKIK
jgi:coenzyme F420-reducing hydrogenase beta subunit